MQEIIIRQALLSDLAAVTALEQQCFPASEAASRNTFSQRLHSFPECFWIAESGGQITAMINGMTTDRRDLTDEMYEKKALYSADGAWLMLFGVATHPDYQKKGLASRLMNHVIEEMKRQEKSGLVLTCKEELLPFYQRFGFVSEGVSDSVHGGAVWYQMRLDFEQELFRCDGIGDECSFYQNGRRYLLYGWRQGDGDYLNVSDETGQIIWQTAKSGQAACNDFMAAYRSQALY
jgi:predicted N-acetyltransferase YhbS